MKDYIQHINQEGYHLLIESVTDYAILLIDVDGHVVSWNKGAEQIKGYAADEIIGQHISVFYTMQDIRQDAPQRNLQKAKDMGRYEDEGWRVRKDGSVFWANVVITALRNSNGCLTGFSKVTTDLTGRRKAEDEIKRLNKELQIQLQYSQAEALDYKHAIEESAIVAVTDQRGVINYVNDNFCKISKYKREELIGQDHRIINSGYHAKEVFRNLWLTIANGKIWRGELKNKAKDGSFYWVDTTIVPFLNHKGKPYQYMAIRSDITQRKLAEEQLNKINEGLEERIKLRTLELTEALERAKDLSEMKSRFVSIASHEFRTPLTAILSGTSLIEHYLKTGEVDKAMKHIERTKMSVKSLTYILNDFLSLEKLDQGRVEVAPVKIILDELINDVIEEMDGMVKKKNQKIVYTKIGGEEIFQDSKILRNVLLNLLSNAVKYSPKEKTIAITVDATDENVTIAIRDDGIGIPLEAQKNLFSKFFRADNAVSIQGTGLGLNIVKRYVELMHGNIRFNSRENHGSTFTVTVPDTYF